eukprot:CAMPEP_0177725478 /NCGR_PEP_ID=MMETSP0484_2-20121128/19272_1 /TAXON_ID=354590 /ORGANISM="Rhodomonas lens, Strain RHODO" /LENGTH=36 /DNA_ID= /DNA_START= /DNA_END= /DNA_ORIENTATION=
MTTQSRPQDPSACAGPAADALKTRADSLSLTLPSTS